MTAYMISFALDGLVVLAICDPWFGRREACQGCYPCVRVSADKPRLTGDWGKLPRAIRNDENVATGLIPRVERVILQPESIDGEAE
jgi:hypothetical protein